MIDRHPRQNPTEAELSLLNVLWKMGPSTVREIHEQVSQYQKTGYTTVLKILQVMHEKTLVKRDESARAHVYSAAFSEAETQNSLLSNLISKAFSGSKFQLVVRALGESSSKQEIDEIRQYLNELESK